MRLRNMAPEGVTIEECRRSRKLKAGKMRMLSRKRWLVLYPFPHRNREFIVPARAICNSISCAAASWYRGCL